MNPSGFVVETANRLTYVGRAADDGERTVTTAKEPRRPERRWRGRAPHLNTTTLFYLLVMRDAPGSLRRSDDALPRHARRRLFLRRRRLRRGARRPPPPQLVDRHAVQLGAWALHAQRPFSFREDLKLGCPWHKKAKYGHLVTDLEAAARKVGRPPTEESALLAKFLPPCVA